jgi:hypothetical protein
MSLAGTDASTGNVVLGGFVIGVVESGGNCTFAVLRGTVEVVARSTTGQSNSDTTSCGSIEIARGEVPGGSYTATLTYVNASGRATSEPMPLEVSS